MRNLQFCLHSAYAHELSKLRSSSANVASMLKQQRVVSVILVPKSYCLYHDQQHYVHCCLMVMFYTRLRFETAPFYVRCSKGCCLVSHGNEDIRCSGAILALLLHLLTLKMNTLCPSETSRTVYPATHRCLSEDQSLHFCPLPCLKKYLPELPTLKMKYVIMFMREYLYSFLENVLEVRCQHYCQREGLLNRNFCTFQNRASVIMKCAVSQYCIDRTVCYIMVAEIQKALRTVREGTVYFIKY